MNKIRCILALLLASAGVQGTTFGQVGNHSRQVSCEVYFPIGRSDIDSGFEGNKIRLYVFTRTLEEVLADPNYVVSRMVLVGTASPDGRESVNETLAGLRAQALADYVAAHTAIPADKIEVVNGGENWSGLRQMMESSEELPFRSQMLELMDIPESPVRKHRMMYYADSKPWLWMYEHFFPALRMGAGGTRGHAVLSHLSRGNWERTCEIVRASELDDATKRSLEAVLSGEPDAARRMERLQVMCADTATYAVLRESLLEGLLDDENALSQDNWTLLRERVAASELPNREAILHIVDNTPASQDREAAIRALDGGTSWRSIGDLLLPELLTGTEEPPLTGSGISFYYELNPESQEPAASTAQEAAATDAAASAKPEETPQPRVSAPFVSLKTDLMLWGGVMPDFRIGTWTPNLSAEIYFARRWSAQAGYAYSNWDAWGGGKGLCALSVGDLEARYWFGKASLFKGFYLGVYGQYGQYDVQQTATGQTGSFWGAGLGAGWLQQLSERWAVEAQLRGGYRSAQNETYDIEPEHDYFNAGTTEEKFPVQLRLQIVYRFGKTQK